MIERLLAGEAALARDELDAAERLFSQVAEADPRNAIAVVGLARVAFERGDQAAARATAERALAIDPDEAAAARLLAELDVTPALVLGPEVRVAAEPPMAQPPEPAPLPTPPEPVAKRGWRGWLARLLRRR